MAESKVFSNEEYTVGWICALPCELAVAKSVLDQIHGQPTFQNGRDVNVYWLGSIKNHNIMIACLPASIYGTASAATVATHMLDSFPSIRFGLLVGIGGGVPSHDIDLRLGDVVVSQPGNGYGGVVQHDFGKRIDGGTFQRTGFLNMPPIILLNGLAALQAQSLTEDIDLLEHVEFMFNKYAKMRKTFSRPKIEKQSSVSGSDAAQAADGTDSPEQPQIHYGTIGSGNAVIKDKAVRDELRDKHNIICVEMEAAGLMNFFPCLVIRGICDWADSTKNDLWHNYAAATAAAYAKELLGVIQAPQVAATPTAAKIMSSLQEVNENIRSVESNIAAMNIVEEDTKKGVQDLKIRGEEDKRREVLTWLGFIGVSPNYEAACKMREPSTGDWLLKSTDFVNWRSQPDTLMLLHGFAGSGKTVLCSTAIQEIKSICLGDPAASLAFFYFDFRDQEKRTVSSFLCSLIAQMCETRSEIPKDIFNLYDQRSQSHHKPSVSISTLLETSKGVKTNNMHILVTSRQIKDITDVLNPMVTQSMLLTDSKINQDISLHIHNQVFNHPKLSSWPVDLKDMIEEKRKEKAQGMYVSLGLLPAQHFEKVPENVFFERQTRTIAEKFGRNYSRILQGIEEEESKEALAALQWLAFSERPLTSDELAEAVVLGPDTRKLSDRDLLRHPTEVLAICSTLIVIGNDRMSGDETDEADAGEYDMELLGSKTVTFAHFSVKEYVTSDRVRFGQGATSNFCFSEYAAHAFIGQTCLAYLSLFDAPDSWSVQSRKEFPLIGYAAQHWPKHARVAEYLADHSEKTALLSLRLFDSNSHAYLNWLRCWDPDRAEQLPPNLADDFTNTTPPIYYAALLRLPILTQELLPLEGVDVNAKGGLRGNALTAAASNKFEPALPKLIEEQQVATHEESPAGESKLVVVAKDQAEAVVRVLLANGATIDAANLKGETALHAVARSGNEDVLQLLLAHNPNKEAMDGNKETPLHIAADKGNTETVRLLLKAGANVHAKQERGLTALHKAAMERHAAIASLLLDGGARVEERETEEGATPLHAAASRANSFTSVAGHSAVARVLIEHGADIKALSDSGWRPLLICTSDAGCKDAFVKVLLDKGADINATVEGMSSLYMAVGNGNCPLVSLLLTRGAKIPKSLPRQRASWVISNRLYYEACRLIRKWKRRTKTSNPADDHLLHDGFRASYSGDDDDDSGDDDDDDSDDDSYASF